MIENKKLFDNLQREWKSIKSEPFDADKVKSFQERVSDSRGDAWVDNRRVDELYRIYQQLGADILDSLIANRFDDLQYLHERMRWFGMMKSGNRTRVVKYILQLNPSPELLQEMLYMSAFETEALALEGLERILELGAEDYQLRWLLEQKGYAGVNRPSVEYCHKLMRRVSNELLDRSPTRSDLLNIMRLVPPLRDEAWSRLKSRGFLLGTLTKLVREFPDKYAKFAWGKILEHDASAKRMEKITCGFDIENEKAPKYVKQAADWLAKNVS